MSDETVMLAVDDLHCGYQRGVDILQGLSLTVRTRSLSLIIGPNGAGKSSLLRAIFGFLTPHACSIAFRGESIYGQTPYRVMLRGLATVPKELYSFPHLTIMAYLRSHG